MTRYTWLFAT